MPKWSDFYVRARGGQPFHVETRLDPERMLCGLSISVDHGLTRSEEPKDLCPTCRARRDAQRSSS